MSEARAVKSGSNATGIERPRVVRRRYLIDPRRQLRTAVMTTSLTLAVVLAVNIGFAFLRSSQSEFLAAVAPQLTPLLEEQDATFSLTMIAISFCLVIAVALTTIVQTHRTAGAVFAVGQRIDRVKAGDLHVTLRLRERDNLQDLEAPFNEMVGALRRRALEEAETLDGLASRASKLGPTGDDIAAALGDLALHKRQMGT